MSNEISVKNKYKRTVDFLPVQFAASATLSDVISMGGMQLRGILIPSTWTTADVSFIGSTVDSTYLGYVAQNIQNFDGTNKMQLVIPGVASGDWVPLFAHWFDAIPYIQLQSSNAQSSATTVLLAVQPLYQGVHG